MRQILFVLVFGVAAIAQETPAQPELTQVPPKPTCNPNVLFHTTACEDMIVNKAVITVLKKSVIADGSADGIYYSAPGIAQAANGDYVLVYNVGTNHVTTIYHSLRRSTDKGRTWGAQVNQWIANSPDPTLARAPLSRDLIVEFGKPNLDNVSGAAFARSTDSGETWGAFTFFDDPVDATTFTPALYLIDGSMMYAPAYGPYVGNDGTDDAIIWLSDDDGFTWKKISTVRQRGDAGINETSIAKIGPTTLLAISRDDAGANTWGHVSKDNGLTWGQQIDYTPQVGVIQLPQLLRVRHMLLLFGRNPSANELVVFASFDGGTTFGSKTILETYTGLSIDGGYCWPILRDDGKVFVVYYADSQGLRFPDIKSVLLKVERRDYQPPFRGGLAHP